MTHLDTSRIPRNVRTICRTLQDAGAEAWVVGGCLRDLLLGKPASDWDIATSAKPERVRRLFRKVIPTGIAHGTVTVRIGGTSYEVTTFRGEGAYTDGRHPDEVFFVGTIEEDLSRRDFTVNALAYDPTAERLVDPFGGLDDLKRQVIRAVGPPLQRFAEDGLRVLRAARFCAALSFDLDPATEAAIRPSLETFRQVSAERVRDEWVKSMKASTPSRAFRVMHRTGILEQVFPALHALDALQIHAWSFHGLEHAMATLDSARAGGGDTVLCLVALMSGVGRPLTASGGFAHHATAAADLVGRWFRDYRFSNEERRRATHLVTHQNLLPGPKPPGAGDVRRWVQHVTPEAMDDAFALRRAILDGAARSGTTHLDEQPLSALRSELEQLETDGREVIRSGCALSVGQLAITGRDVLTELAVPPGRMVGTLLEAALEAVLDDPTLNERQTLLSLMRKQLEASQ